MERVDGHFDKVSLMVETVEEMEETLEKILESKESTSYLQI